MSQPRPVITLEGESVALGPIRRDLIPLYQVWMNDLETTRFLRMWPMTLDEEIAWFERTVKDTTMAIFTVYELPNFRPVGNVDLHDIDVRNRTAELGILIGENDARGRGIGTEAIRLACDYGFNALDLHSIMLLTFGWNFAGQKAYEKAGFREIGRRRQARYFNGRYWDDIYYDLLREEFVSPVLQRIVTNGIITEED